MLKRDEEVNGCESCSAEDMGELRFMLSPDDPDMPTLQSMHKMIAQSPRAQSKFFLLMDDVLDIYLMGFDQSFYGRHHVQQSFHQSDREDSFASTAMPALGGYGIAELEGMESQERGFQHGHRKKYAIPHTKERHVIDLFKEKDEAVLHSLLKAMRDALVLCAGTLQYEASTLPAAQMQQTVLPEKFTKKQQLRSRLDGGVELDGSVRPLLASTKDELLGHHVLEYRRAAEEERDPRPMYSQVSLQGCHQSLTPSYRLPQSVGSIRVLDELGMAQNPERQGATATLPWWNVDLEGQHATGLGNDDVQDPNTVLNSLTADANAWALSFCRDFRALHQLNHDHDCTNTCIKYVKKGKESAEKALKKGWTIACRFFFYHVLTLTYMCAEAKKMITKAFRRRGKKLVQAAHIASTNEHGELFRVRVKRDTPFRSATSDVGQVWSRSNNDFQFMPRFLDLEMVHELDVEGVPPPAVDPKLALAMYGVRLRLPDEPLLRRCFHSIAAMFQAAHNCDYYITKYQGKLLAQMQNLLANIAFGLRRLEEEEEALGGVRGVVQPVQERARRATLKIAAAANRCSWVSSCEMASFIRTGGDARRTHRPVHIFLSRPMYLLKECQRLLQRPARELLEAPQIRDDSFRPMDVVIMEETAKEETKAVVEDEDVCDEDDNVVAAEASSEEEVTKSGDPQNAARAAHAVLEEQMEGGASSNAAQLDVEGINAGHQVSAEQPATGDQCDREEEHAAEAPKTKGLADTTSAHDDWLRRGPFLYDFDFHTYVKCVRRVPRPRNIRNEGDIDVCLCFCSTPITSSRSNMCKSLTCKANAKWSCLKP